MTMAKRTAYLVLGIILAMAGMAARVPAAHAGLPIVGLVSDVASDRMPAIPGGYCYSGANQDLCRRVLVIKQIGGWIYVGGIISRVTDRTTGITRSGYHNLFRFNASTGKVDTTFQPQFYKSAQANNTTAYLDSAVTGIASNGAGTLYVAGKFTTYATGPGAAGAVRRGVAAINETTKALQPFNAKVCQGGGSCIVNDVEYLNGTVWLGGNFSFLAGQPIKALAFVNPTSGALTGTQVPVSGAVISTAGTGVAQIAINPQVSQAVMIGNFTTVGGKSHDDVAVLDINGGSATVDSWNDPVNLAASNSTNCHVGMWARGVDWDPTGTYFDIAASGGGGFDAFGTYGALCDAFSRFKSDGNPKTTHPLIVNVTGFDSLFTVVDTGGVAYTGGHNKYLNHAVYISGVKVSARQETHYGLGAIDVNPADPGYGKAITSWNNNTTTGRGAGWAGSVSTGSMICMGGDAQTVGTDTTIKRLACFS
jgi:hypothetical protein